MTVVSGFVGNRGGLARVQVNAFKWGFVCGNLIPAYSYFNHAHIIVSRVLFETQNRRTNMNTNRSNHKGLFNGSAEDRGDSIDWELRPGGMLVQKRVDGPAPAGPMIKVKVSHGSYQHEVSIPAQATFGDLKKVLSQDTGLEPQEQRLLFRGKEKENDECLHIAGVKDMGKVVLMEDPASKEKKLEEMQRNQSISRACQAVAHVRAEVDKLSEQVSALETAINGGTKVADNEFVVVTEMLMIQLLNLDGIEAEGEAKVQRRVEVRRVQNYVEMMDTLKARNANPLCSNTVTVTTRWETFDTGVGSLNAPLNPAPTKITDDWELFD